MDRRTFDLFSKKSKNDYSYWREYLVKKKSVSFLSIAIVAILSTLPSSTQAAKITDFSIDNVYEFDINTYEKVEQYNNFSVDLLSDNKLSISINTGEEQIEVEEVPYTLKSDSKSKSNVISAKGTLSSGDQFVLRLGYDKKENANGDFIITQTPQGDEFPVETFIHFNDNEFISLKDMHNAIKKNSRELVAPMVVADLPYIKSYKYGTYIFSNVQWNTSKLVSNNDNNLQIKFLPLWGALQYWTDAYGNQGTLIKAQSDIFTVLTRYESYVTTSPYAIAYTYPIVKETTQKTIPISLSYRAPGGVSVGTTLSIPIGSSNKKTDGNPARWDLNDLIIPLQDSSGRDLQEYVIQGITKVTGAGSNVKIQTGVYVKIGVMYAFPDKPVQWTTLVDSYNHDYINAQIQ